MERKDFSLLLLGLLTTFIGMVGGYMMGRLDGPPQTALYETVTPDYVDLNVKFATIYVSDKNGDWLLAFEDDQAATKTASSSNGPT